MATIDTQQELSARDREAGINATRAVGPRWSFKNMTAKASTTIVLANDCIVHSVTVGGSGSASTFGVYDSATAAATAAGKILLYSPLKTLAHGLLDAYCSNGLVLKTTGASAVDVTVTYINV